MIHKISVFYSSLIISITTLLFILFFVTPQYKSTSVLDVSFNESEAFSFDLANTFMSSGVSSDAFQVKLYLESRELSTLFKESFNINDIFGNDTVTFFSRYRESSYRSFHDYFQNKFSVSIDNESNTLILETYAFSPKEAKDINLKLINITANFFNRKSRLAALNNRSSKFCELYFTNAGNLDVNSSTDQKSYDLYPSQEISSANELLAIKAKKFQDFCIEEFNASKKNPNVLIDIPEYELRTINAEASKRIISDIYMNSIGAFTEADYMEVIAEPVLSNRPESRKPIIYSILSFIFSAVIILSIKIIIRLSNEFQT